MTRRPAGRRLGRRHLVAPALALALAACRSEPGADVEDRASNPGSPRARAGESWLEEATGDADDHEDVFVANVGPDRLCRGLGGGVYRDVSRSAGITAYGGAPDDWSSSAAFCDVDRDVDLDLYVVVAWAAARIASMPAWPIGNR